MKDGMKDGTGDEDTRYEAVRSRDGRFDGEFFFAVRTTGIYCRPSCPAVTPKRENVRFYASAAAAQGAGFRACRRCRPDAVPGSAEWNVRADSVGRAMRLIGDGVVDREGVAGLAVRLGYSARQVRRQLTAEVGAGPVALARAQRAHTARVLLRTTALPVTEIAFASGFASVRQFNDTIRAVYAMTPSALRAGAPRRPAGSPTTGIPLRLAYRGPYRSTALFDVLAAESVTGVEETTGVRGHRTHQRTLRLPYGTAIAEVDERPGAAPPGRSGGWLDARLHLTDPRDLTTAVQRLRRLFDLDADPYAVDERLGEDARLAPLVAARPGLRSPGTADPEEFAVRALVGRAEAERLVRAYGKMLDAPRGTLTHLFPEPGALAGAGGPLGALARALADGTCRLDVGADRDATEAALLALPGLDARTVAEIRTRALGDPDVAPPGEAVPDAWRPWRSYAVQHLRTQEQGVQP
ncbi:DNA-3-methyladenine glycosylase 2 family protein [Streptomyces caniscabiei]|uniref:Ada metal-binding domain-containing protein n=1 Tax=Streptomyces caniscabiei TaxID=2746961 RepID=A0ABU4MTG1_9ACTN|nr:Ada metal-binding domain-containing protein [Streptomyces caniscabiei]MBE4734562.1 helix-turn-helix domain-containing protein [Streptomyces caniscabiei]MBE4755433.1 helix-turn-helix domain-containing protein [Streptomyces caniscabiei]MBE4772443.1 helix-turn-helix domain-containing protein [Streptomyces caniscabiei]MBE4783283.1 helix-turn-helix domain-containing protein [Streptomyces caniscabiei]MBE4792587.1 helix-turn-helix domain-containing protein [Streptomyces caniscabiei]